MWFLDSLVIVVLLMFTYLLGCIILYPIEEWLYRLTNLSSDYSYESVCEKKARDLANFYWAPFWMMWWFVLMIIIPILFLCDRVLMISHSLKNLMMEIRPLTKLFSAIVYIFRNIPQLYCGFWKERG